MSPQAIVPSAQQKAIIDWVISGSGNLMIEALAGSGKTSVLLQMLPYMSGDIFMGAYNKSIQLEIKEKVKKLRLPNVTVQTIHGAGLQAFKFAGRGRNANIESNKLRFIIDELGVDDDTYLTYEQFLYKLVGLGKLSGIDVIVDNNEATWLELVEYYSVDDEIPADKYHGEDDLAELISNLIGYARNLYEVSLDRCIQEIDFDDMLLAPLYYKSRLRKFDWVLIDECLIGDTPIFLSDGSTSPISKLVETKYDGSVYSMDDDGGIVHSKVTGWHKIPLNKKLLQIKTRRHGYKKDGTRLLPQSEKGRFGERILICTEDHKIWKDGLWTPARELMVGDLLIEESQAPPAGPHYNHKYKIGKSGRRKLGALMRSKNATGSCGQSYGFGRIPKRGGNGREPSQYETALLERLGDGWVGNYVVPTRKRRDSGYPTCFKIDIANPSIMVAIELDGHSHGFVERKEQDAREDAFLTDLGWTVLRITNKEALTISDDLLEEIKANSPVETEVVSIEEWIPKEPFVYDISVEGTHCYFANGILVHNCQDLSAVRTEIAIGMLKPEGRMVCVGDRFQSVYGFSGAAPDSMDQIKTRMDMATLPLTTTYRCPKVVVELANTWVPALEARPGAPEGVRRTVLLEPLPCQTCGGSGKLQGLKIGERTRVCTLCKGRGKNGPGFWDEACTLGADAVILCRVNRPLVELAYLLLKKGIPCQIEGRDFAGSLVKLCQKWKVRELDKLEDKLTDYRLREAAKWRARKSEERAAAIEDKVDTLLTLLDAVRSSGKERVSELIDRINLMYGDTEAGKKPKVLTLSSIHKGKGKEWRKVYILGRNHYMPSKWATQDWQIQAESNLSYVAVTRSQHTLVDIIVPLERKRS